MPVYLFTFHAYRSWMPDRRRGYVRRKKGILPRDVEMARKYADAAKHDACVFETTVQQALIEAALIACRFQKVRPHAFTTEKSHFHALVSWTGRRTWMQLRTGLKTSLSKKLKVLSETAASQIAFSRAGSRKHVSDRAHFDFLMTDYLRKHSGAHWFDPNFVPWDPLESTCRHASLSIL